MNPWLKPKMAATILFLLAFWILLQMCFALLHQISDIDYGADTLAFIKNVILDLFLSHSFLEMVLFFLMVLTSYRLITFIIKQAHLRYKWADYVKIHQDPKLTKKFTSRYRTWRTPIYVIRETSPLALVEGMLFPRIIISTGLLELLTSKELQAVLLHERYHCLNRHPLKKYLTQLITSSIPYVSILKGLGQFYIVWIEILADRYVFTQTNSPLHLGSALLKLVKTSKFDYPLHGVSFADAAINYRLSQIIDPEQVLNVPVVSATSVLSSLVVLVGMFTIILFHCI